MAVDSHAAVSGTNTKCTSTQFVFTREDSVELSLGDEQCTGTRNTEGVSHSLEVNSFGVNQ